MLLIHFCTLFSSCGIFKTNSIRKLFFSFQKKNSTGTFAKLMIKVISTNENLPLHEWSCCTQFLEQNLTKIEKYLRIGTKLQRKKEMVLFPSTNPTALDHHCFTICFTRLAVRIKQVCHSLNILHNNLQIRGLCEQYRYLQKFICLGGKEKTQEIGIGFLQFSPNCTLKEM